MAWDNESDYEYTSDHTLRDWGWEFIRRNTEYIAEWERVFVEFMAKKKSGELYRDLLGYPDDLFLKGLKPQDITEEFYKVTQKSFYNQIDPERYEDFAIPAPPNNPWKLRQYQDPRSKKLIRPDYPQIMALEVTKSDIIKLHTIENSLYTRIDLTCPLIPQLEQIRKFAKQAQKKLNHGTTNRMRTKKNKVWKSYLQVLDAHNAGTDRRSAAKKLFPKEESSQQQSIDVWDEKLRQAKEMVSQNIYDLMI